MQARSIGREVLRPRGPESEVGYPGDASAQGKGVGSQLLRYGVGRVLRQGATVVWFYGRASARIFYEHHGFRALGDELTLPNTGPHYLFIFRSG